MDSSENLVTVASRDAGAKPIGICSRRVTKVSVEFMSERCKWTRHAPKALAFSHLRYKQVGQQ
jgi:hypothetical protein